jgi:ABC-type transport system substrate-binding protein
LSGARPDAIARDLLSERWNSRTDPLLDQVEFLTPEGIQPVELLVLGEADLALVHGRQVSRVRAAAGHTLVRAPGWDRTYALLCDPQARWTNDPNFRRWFAETIDRVDLVEYLFQGLAAPAFSLLSGPGGPRWAPPLMRPYGPTSRPLLDLGFDPGDANALAIAARLKAAFALEGMELRLVEQGGRDRPELTLIAYQRWGDDALESLTGLIPDGAEGARSYLRQAEAADGESRSSLVALAEDAVLMDARLIPLLRLDAWLALAPGLRGVETGWSGDLALEKIWWSP